jgi:23S rRNA (pseudouridine1915-N3)-methyltransferase
MKIDLLCVGRLKDEPERLIVARYLERFHHFAAPLGFAGPVMTELTESRAKSPRERKSAEAAELRRKLKEGARVIALDERGQAMSSADFAALLAGWRDDGARHLNIVIGGPDGLDAEFARAAALNLSLGRMTLPHGLARAVFAEQLYRAASILAGHPYHRA